MNKPIIKIFCEVTKRYIDSNACTECQYRLSMGCTQYEKIKSALLD